MRAGVRAVEGRKARSARNQQKAGRRKGRQGKGREDQGRDEKALEPHSLQWEAATGRAWAWSVMKCLPATTFTCTVLDLGGIPVHPAGFLFLFLSPRSVQ